MFVVDDPDLARVVAELRHDRVIVDVAAGSGESVEYHDRIAALVRDVPFPVYVALLADLPGVSGPDAADAFALMLSRRLGARGVFVVGEAGRSPRVNTWGLGAQSAAYSLTTYAGRDEIERLVSRAQGQEYTVLPGVINAEAAVAGAERALEIATEERRVAEFPSPLSTEQVEDLAVRAESLQARANWRPRADEYVAIRWAQPGLNWLWGALTGLLVTLLLGQSLRGWPRGRSRPGSGRSPAAAPPETPSVEAERKAATVLLEELSRSLTAADPARIRDQDRLGAALSAKDAVEQLLDSEDAADLVGAWTLARTGLRDVALATSGRGQALRTCFFDPRHPHGDREVRWRLGQGQVEVPVCRACARRIAAGKQPDMLRLTRRAKAVPYYERDDVWARTGFGSLTGTFAADVLADRGHR